MTRSLELAGYAVRRTQCSDCSLLPAIERSAAELFAADPALGWLARQDPIEPDRHAELIGSGLCFVALSDEARPCGFIATEVIGTDLHVWELSVEQTHQKRGIGRRLLVAAEQAAASFGLRRLTLTTFRDLAWNGPFYETCGFAEWPDAAPEPRLTGLLQTEADHGLPVARRCAMVKQL